MAALTMAEVERRVLEERPVGQAAKKAMARRMGVSDRTVYRVLARAGLGKRGAKDRYGDPVHYTWPLVQCAICGIEEQRRPTVTGVRGPFVHQRCKAGLPGKRSKHEPEIGVSDRQLTAVGLRREPPDATCPDCGGARTRDYGRGREVCRTCEGRSYVRPERGRRRA